MSEHIPEQLPEQTFTPREAESLILVPSHSVRRWARYHAIHLSPYANPTPGQVRRFTRRDIEVLRAAKTLHERGLTVAVINEMLANTAVGEIDSEPNSAESLLVQQEGQSSAQIIQMGDTALVPVYARLDAIERNRRDVFIAYAAGTITAALFFLIIVLIAWLYGGR